jgi:hypothetical protein
MYILINSKKIDIIKANTFFKRLTGLMGKKNISYGMLFPHTNSIHTFFMKDAIDVIGLNEKNEMILKVENVPKNKIISVHNSIKKTSILELPKNTSKSLNIGDTLTFISK